MTTSVSPLVIACGIIPSTFLYSRDIDAVHVRFVWLSHWLEEGGESCAFKLADVDAPSLSLHLHSFSFHCSSSPERYEELLQCLL